MLLGRISGKVTTNAFTFEAKLDVKKFEYVKVPHRIYDWVLCQIVEIETTTEATTARCHVLGYAEKGKVQRMRIPFDVGSEVFLADDEFIREIVRLDGEGGYLGKLDGRDVDVHLDLNKLLTRHVAVLAKSGSGKSYAVGVLLEEIIERGVPVLVIDPHGEYGSLRSPSADDAERLAPFHVQPRGYPVREYGDPNERGTLPLRLPNNLTQQELVHLIPGKLNNTQLGILYNAIRGIDEINFETVLLQLEQEESNAKWSIINLIEHLRTLGIFSSAPLAYNELLKGGSCSVVNMRGFAPEIQQIIVYKLAKDLFELRKQNKVPPFFLVVEEAHNYCPERSFGEATSSKILRTIASEGRKFGLGLCVISQRPARVDKSVLSQCTTQLILKVTNPNDLKAVSTSVEGLTAESEREIQNLAIGTALVTGVVDMPLFVNVRPRRTEHGGHAVNILEQAEFLEQQEEFASQDLIPVIQPLTTVHDLKLAEDRDVAIHLVPGYLFTCEEKEETYKILVEMIGGEVVVDLEEFATRKLPELRHLSARQLRILQAAHRLKRSTVEQLMKEANVMDIQEPLADLSAKGYLTLDGAVALTDRYLLSTLRSAACQRHVEYQHVAGERHSAEQNLDDVRNALSRFTTVLDHQECTIVRHELL